MSTLERRRKPWRLPLSEVNREHGPWVYRHLVLGFVRLVIPLVARRHWAGQHHVPQDGGLLVVANHLSNFDPIVLGEYLIYSGRWPRFLGKSEIWKVPVLGWIARKCEQIPVYRNTEQARDSLIHARRALERGKCVIIYPEGTITADPDGWPMTGRRGAAQLALETGVTVMPVAQVGADQILGRKHLEWRKLFGGRRDVHIQAGTPLDLSAFAAQNPDGGEAPKELLDQVTDHFLDVLTAMVADLRGEEPPEGRWDMRAGRRVDSSTH
ncbi:1-acyl-sn-glycerol-3-phosphate acyltransferase [Tessaracoccus sp. MC1865]|uniref:lysophospholipid acyltransferase family protein n=1 Tax=unclassified Tessaracoccus TaxID=2635419 RepID=UPI0015FF2E34|nr:lysophospholipid acyltransferase family protein [Tessaracoccus sp. MC1865]MBB1483536.1 1-acyl-sn-glycerol-3-phosphate acyltransferase [Tessaracoccus sp. MC1865]MBB1508969.1 1-acyl-sn-glycerol-3-phosphate acyltransferase [Tessaracoccus sp. MC1756]QTO36626.1 1-acyl-sn-glycerol-3-phosphate acyltransferase [Tessaracoccus sp. MC1865]